jgi:pyruvate/2-oxoglutarate dehydrogenase complex dihydrolipoamide dehydrogenase (E3) component
MYDLIVIGSGAAGTLAAVAAKHEGASRVVIVEQGPVWGTCINVGCIPSKLLLALAESVYYRNHGRYSGIDQDWHDKGRCSPGCRGINPDKNPVSGLIIHIGAERA